MKLHIEKCVPRVSPSNSRHALQFVLLHGFLAHSGSYHSFVTNLRRTLDNYNQGGVHAGGSKVPVDYSIMSVDARNHGLSPHTTSHTLDDLVKDLDHLMRHHVNRDVPTVAVGHSMGSATWTEYLVQNKDANVAAFISLDMPPITASGMSLPLQKELADMIDEMQRVDLSRIVDMRSANEEFQRSRIKDPRVRGLCSTNLKFSRAVESRSSCSWKCNLPVLQQSLQRKELFLSDDFSEKRSGHDDKQQQQQHIGVPVLSVLGGDSPIGSNAHYQSLWDKHATNVEQHVIPGGTHTVHFDKQKETAAVVEGFLKRIDLL